MLTLGIYYYDQSSLHFYFSKCFLLLVKNLRKRIITEYLMAIILV